MIFICACCVDRLIYIYLLIPEGNFWHVIIIRQRPGMNPEDVVIFLNICYQAGEVHMIIQQKASSFC